MSMVTRRHFITIRISPGGSWVRQEYGGGRQMSPHALIWRRPCRPIELQYTFLKKGMYTVFKAQIVHKILSH